MRTPGERGQLKTSEWEQLQGLADRFESAWHRNGSADLGQFLPAPGHPLRAVVLNELIKIDLECRWSRGQPVRLEHYLQRFPELGSARLLAPHLIFEEYRARRKHDPGVQLDTYRGRFPGQFQELERLIKLEPPAATGPAASAATPGAGPSTGGYLTIVGDYRLIKRIGAGGFGEVWLAEAPGGVEVAVKVLFRSIDHEEARRELQALELIKRLRHHFLLQTQAFWAMADRLYIVMELADCSLRDRLKQCRQQGLHGVPAEELIVYIREAAEGLDFLHENQVLHRDIKPENILLLHRHAKLADFGLARLHEARQLASVTCAGTPAYMPPEMWGKKICEASDQYCLAVTYAELRLDRRLFAGQSPLELMQQHLLKAPDLAPLPPGEQQVLHRALAKDPGQRFPTCSAFTAALEGAVLGSARRPPSTPGPLTTPGPSGTEEARDTPPGRHDLAQEPTLVGPPALVGDGGSVVPRPARKWAVPVRKKGLGLVLAVLLLAGGLLALFALGWFHFEEEEPFFVLEQPPALVLPAGKARRLTLTVRRRGFKGPIPLTFQGVPSLVTLPPATVLEGESQVRVVVRGDENAVPGRTTIQVQAGEGPARQTASFELVIERPPVPWREGWRRVETARVVRDGKGRLYYDQIDVVPPKGPPVRFVLAPWREEGKRWEKGEDPTTFYISRDKITVKQFRAFAADHKLEPGSAHWSEKGWAGKDYPRDGQPVLGVTVRDAHTYARWLQGSLPTRFQWDRAAGRFDKPRQGVGPFVSPSDGKGVPHIALNREGQGPMPVGEARDDRSPLGCRDMAGNGREWTRDLVKGFEAGKVDRLFDKKVDPGLLVILRGRSFLAMKPLNFRELDEAEESSTFDVVFWQEVPRDVGFRVVIEP